MDLNHFASQPDYVKTFWNILRDKSEAYDKLKEGKVNAFGTYVLPLPDQGKFQKALVDRSIFRQIGSCVNAHNGTYRIFGTDSDDIATFVPENDTIPLFDAIKDFTPYKIESHKLASLVKLDLDFIHDASFPIQDYLIGKFAKACGRGETNAFINGTGVDMPTGILHDEKGAKVGATATTINYDDVVTLYFSIKSEYRTDAYWMMNDETAMLLRTLKDEGGNYLWNHNTDTIFGKPVIISEFMPNAEPGKKPIAFGDFSYYCVIDRQPVSVRAILEKFALYGQIGYLALEFLDAKLIRQEAISAMKIAE